MYLRRPESGSFQHVYAGRSNLGLADVEYLVHGRGDAVDGRQAKRATCTCTESSGMYAV